MKVAFFTGAGISASAGIPTYRDGGSSWRDADLEKKSHATRYGNHLDELWDNHWGPVEAQMLKAIPTHAHMAIANFQRKYPDSIVITQNIDDLHERAGSVNVHHLHGRNDAFCMRCKSTDVLVWAGNGAPKCMDCGSCKTRPGVVLFGESLSSKMVKNVNRFIQQQSSAVVVVGSSLIVQPATTLVMDAFGRKRTILVNKDKTPFSPFFDVKFTGNADDLIDRALEVVRDGAVS